MADQYDLTPTDGISDHWIMMDGLEVVRADPRCAVVKFRIFRRDGPNEEDLGELVFEVGPAGDGVQGMIARAHDELVDALRQMLYTADVLRRSYREGSDGLTPPDTGQEG